MLHIRSMAGFGSCPAGRRVTSQIVLGHVGAPAARFALRGSSVLRKDLGGNPVPGLRLLWGRRIYVVMLRIQSWEGLNGTLSCWAPIPIEALLDTASLEVAVK